MEDRQWQKVKLWASLKAAMEVPFVTDDILWKQLRLHLHDLGIFPHSILDDAERDLFSAGHVRLPLATLRDATSKLSAFTTRLSGV